MKSNTSNENCHAWVLVKLGDADDYKDSVTKCVTLQDQAWAILYQRDTSFSPLLEGEKCHAKMPKFLINEDNYERIKTNRFN